MGVFAPWCLGMGLVVSFTAVAGQDASIGASTAPLSVRRAEAPVDLIPSIASVRHVFGMATSPAAVAGGLRLAALNVGDPQEFLLRPDEIDPRLALKSGAREFPEIDRSKRGDPVVGLRPTFDAKLRRRGGIEAYRASELLLSARGALAFDRLAPAGEPTPGPDSVSSFKPEPDSAVTTRPSVADASPGQAKSEPTQPSLRTSLGSNARVFDGATPGVPRAVALASATPAPTEATPINAAAYLIPRAPGDKQIAGGHSRAIEVAALPPQSHTSIVPQGDRPNYTALIDQGKADREEHCLAQAIYFEARSEPEAGQAAVAQVVLNRVSSGLYPASVCGVVFQNRHRYKACQFSFACEGKSLKITEAEPWRVAQRIAKEVLVGKTYLSEVGAATHYHATYVKPGWSRRLKKTDKIGQHIFYKLRPGQT
ncbi:MAG: cell wall hydrolase [Beijerinckiaceae bacterium]|nr:cell wall hydrolase [Beijerinckiaceae bacterium]